MRRGLVWKAAGAAAALAIAGFLVAASGVVPLKASSGHWDITRWFLSFSMARSIQTHALGVTVPSLEDPGLVLRGAGHYETGCRPCHGAPGDHRRGVARQMTPTPPWLPEDVPNWDREELFYIVKHGMKFTGMPAWPSPQRDDEVWAMVAFLLRLPDMEPDEYRRLALGETVDEAEAAGIAAGIDLEALQAPLLPILGSCGRCHGVDGRGRGVGAFPLLAGQSPVYLRASLDAYADGARYSGIMEPVAAGLDADTRAALARYYGELGEGLTTEAPGDPAGERPAGIEGEPATGIAPEEQAVPSPEEEARPEQGDPEGQAGSPAVVRGRRLAREGVPERKVPSCAPCHGPGDGPRNPLYPRLAGQPADYLELQLLLFQAGRRGGTPYAHVMERVAAGLTQEQIEDVAAYFASVSPRAPVGDTIAASTAPPPPRTP